MMKDFKPVYYDDGSISWVNAHKQQNHYEDMEEASLAGATRENEDDRMRKMAEIRTSLEKRVNELQTEVEQLRVLLDFVNSALIEKGFKKPEIKPATTTPIAEELAPTGRPIAAPSPVTPILERAQAIPIKTATGELLANLYTDDENMRVVLAPERQFTADTPPFMAFLVERVLTKMQEKDTESARAGEIAPDKILSYEVIKDGDIIRELIIKNTGTDRARELKSTIRWTLEKMHEKIKSTP